MSRAGISESKRYKSVFQHLFLNLFNLLIFRACSEKGGAQLFEFSIFLHLLDLQTRQLIVHAIPFHFLSAVENNKKNIYLFIKEAVKLFC